MSRNGVGPVALSRLLPVGCARGPRLASLPSVDSTRTPFRAAATCSFLLGCLALGAVGPGCVVPQDVERLNPEKNPPRVVIESIPNELIGPYLTLVRAPRDVGCHCELQLSIPLIEDQDRIADLSARWYVDYDLRIPASQGSHAQNLLKGDFSAATAERVGPSFRFNTDALGIVDDGFHTVEVVIAEDGSFDDSPDAQLPQRTLKQGYSAAVYRFFVRVLTDPDVQKCPNQKPSTRICATGTTP